MASVWAIGDIHGEGFKLSTLLDFLPRGENDYTVFLGDYIDRGASSAEVVRRVLVEQDTAPVRTVLLWGNHEDMAASYFNIPSPTETEIEYDPYDWFRNGGLIAMESWGLKPPEMFDAPCPADLTCLFAVLRPFFRGNETGIPGMEPYLFVHAGILPTEEPEAATGERLLWVREEFLQSYNPSGRIVVHGHTPFEKVRVHPDKIGIDTGAVRGGPLTALRLPERTLYQVDGTGRVTVSPLPEFPTGAV
ncbi:MAG: serine/threonine protein phosphatase [Akkermansiaceae bacterium]|nr:serine/threonine protein phosphatase [Armatimonadota bacterium]